MEDADPDSDPLTGVYGTGRQHAHPCVPLDDLCVSLVARWRKTREAHHDIFATTDFSTIKGRSRIVSRVSNALIASLI